MDRDQPSRRTSQVPFLPHQLKPPTQTAPRRDRYRSYRHDYRLLDAVQDDNGYEYDEEFYDDFDGQMVAAPVEDRQTQAVKGKARLSLAPVTDLAQSAANYVSVVPYDDNASGDQEHRHRFSQQLSQFTYGVPQQVEPSSDIHLGPSSSPALQAGQRRAAQSAFPIFHGSTRPLDFQNVPKHAEYVQEEDDYHRCDPITSHTRQTFADDLTDNVHHQEKWMARNQQISVPRPEPQPMHLSNSPPVAQGIHLVPITALPDRLQSIFPFPMFNAVQSKCFDKVFRSDDNFVLASPTGSGKTVVLELAVCRAVLTNTTVQNKVVYQAPTKALCSERQRDWDKKFRQIGLTCAELTGDSDAADLRNVQSANIIITTPEKWDSITRRWKDHEKLMKLIKLFLVDEVHILKEDRGAVLETVVSRMKSIGTDVRFVALSATVPNFHDVASWLGRNAQAADQPAASEKFGEEFRPVKLRKHVCGYVCNNSNDFAFEKLLDTKLPEVITKYCEQRPFMVFCATRNSTVATAKLISNWWLSRYGADRLWDPPRKPLSLLNRDLRDTTASGVAFHHAGLDHDDRLQVEKGYLDGEIKVICCTSTLAVGVNLPCHMVIIKNTSSWTNEGMKEYSDLEMMQMLGRAGRPQFDKSAVAVIMTRQSKVPRYEMMVTGQDLLESKLHLNLIDHMNAEIGLGTIRDLASAKKWLMGTFLAVRMRQNPAHYRLEGARANQHIGEQFDDICFRDISLLREHNLVSGEDIFRCTEFGHAMARYYVHFETMKHFVSIRRKAPAAEILSTVVQATELSMIRFRQGEKSIYKTLNKSPSIRWPIPVNLDSAAHKVSLIVQSILGSADITWDGEAAKHKSQYNTEVAIIFKYINRLIRCIIDCQISIGDSVNIHNALMLERSLGAQIWDDSPLQIKQLEGIGVVAVRKLVNAGIRSMEDLEACDAHRIETLIGRNPPFGIKILEKAKMFPKLRVSLQAQTTSITKVPEGVKIQIKADIGFINDKLPHQFARKLVYVTLLADTSDGRMVHFARISGPKIGSGQSLVFPATLTSPGQSINCYVMCDSIVGSMRGATVKPQIAPSMFSVPKSPAPAKQVQPNVSRRRIDSVPASRKPSHTSDDFGDGDLDDDTLVKASHADGDFDDIDSFVNPADDFLHRPIKKNAPKKAKRHNGPANSNSNREFQPATQLSNGRWACNHKCKDKTICKHYCCKHGLDKPSKLTSIKRKVSGDLENKSSEELPSNNKLEPGALWSMSSKYQNSVDLERLSYVREEKRRKAEYAINGPREYRDLNELHKSIQRKDPPSAFQPVMHKKPSYSYSQGDMHEFAFLGDRVMERSPESETFSDMQSDQMMDFVHTKNMHALEDRSAPLNCGLQRTATPRTQFANKPTTDGHYFRGSDNFNDDDSALESTMIELADSQSPHATTKGPIKAAELFPQNPDRLPCVTNDNKDDFELPLATDGGENDDTDIKHRDSSMPIIPKFMSAAPSTTRGPFLLSTSSVHCDSGDAKQVTADCETCEPAKDKDVEKPQRICPDDWNECIIKDSDSSLCAQSTITASAEEPTLDGLSDIKSWLFHEFGDIVELVEE